MKPLARAGHATLALLMTCAIVRAQCEDVFDPGTSILASGAVVIVHDDALADALCAAGDAASALPVTLLSVKHSGLAMGGAIDGNWSAMAICDGSFLAGCEAETVEEFIRWVDTISACERPPTDRGDCTELVDDLDWDRAGSWEPTQWPSAARHVRCLLASDDVVRAAQLTQRAWRSSDWTLSRSGPTATFGVRNAVAAGLWRDVAAAGLAAEDAVSQAVTGILAEQLEDVALAAFTQEDVSLRMVQDAGDLALFTSLLGREDILAEWVRESPLVAQFVGQSALDDVFDALAAARGHESEAATVAGDLVPYCQLRLLRAVRQVRGLETHPATVKPLVRGILPGMLRVALAVEGDGGALKLVRAAATRCGPLVAIEALRAAQAAGLDSEGLRIAARGVLDLHGAQLEEDGLALVKSMGAR